MLRRFNMSSSQQPNMQLHDTPADANAKLSHAFSPAPPACSVPDTAFETNVFMRDGTIRRGQKVPYMALVGCMLYCAVCTRPAIAYATAACCRYMQTPGKAHWKAAKRILRYLRRTVHFTLRLRGTGPLFAYTDADWNGDCVDKRDSHKSTSGGAVFCGHGPIL